LGAVGTWPAATNDDDVVDEGPAATDEGVNETEPTIWREAETQPVAVAANTPASNAALARIRTAGPAS
jgi:hypothetical protein